MSHRALGTGFFLLFVTLWSPLPARGEVPVPFLSEPPVIDGLLDKSLSDQPSLALTPVRGHSLTGRRAPQVRLAYGTAFLHMHVQFDAEHLEARDRAYQNGDGVLLVVSHAREDDAPSDEFSVLGFSAGQPATRWQQRFTWYRNTALEMRALAGASVATRVGDGWATFEILVPWSDVYPLHPWMSGRLGLNVCVTQALPDDGVARSCLVDDPRVDSENSPRLSVPAEFAPPRLTGEPQVAAVLERNHVSAGQNVRIRLAATAAAPAQFAVTTRVLSGEGTCLASRRTTIAVKEGLGIYDADVPLSTLPHGGYSIEWELAEHHGRMGLSILRDQDDGTLAARLARAAPALARGTVETLRFRIEDIARERRRLRPTDVATSLRLALDDVVEALGAAESGVDAVATRTGVQRRAYRSAVDDTLQPYSIKVPRDYRAGEPYPLLVYLHGSGEDDRGQLTRPWLPEDAILVAPLGRGPSTWYWRDHALDDVRDVIEDVTAHYAVDPARIVLAGFSMGGYGVYVTARESRRRFSGLAVFSGAPRPKGGESAGAPDLLTEKDLSAFSGMPVFVFHGSKDRNLPIDDTRALVDRLRLVGAEVTFIVEDDKGHEAPSDETLRAFAAWFARVTATSAQ